MPDKNLYIIAGCNGAGKTTASFTILPEVLDCQEFVNADEIARGLSPSSPKRSIERRYSRGIGNLFDLYLPIVDKAFIFDNSVGRRELIAQKSTKGDIVVINDERFRKLKESV